MGQRYEKPDRITTIVHCDDNAVYIKSCLHIYIDILSSCFCNYN